MPPARQEPHPGRKSVDCYSHKIPPRGQPPRERVTRLSGGYNAHLDVGTAFQSCGVVVVVRIGGIQHSLAYTINNALGTVFYTSADRRTYEHWYTSDRQQTSTRHEMQYEG